MATVRTTQQQRQQDASNDRRGIGALLEAIADVLRGRRSSRAEISELMEMDEFEAAGCEVVSGPDAEPLAIRIPIRRRG